MSVSLWGTLFFGGVRQVTIRQQILEREQMVLKQKNNFIQKLGG